MNNTNADGGGIGGFEVINRALWTESLRRL